MLTKSRFVLIRGVLRYGISRAASLFRAEARSAKRMSHRGIEVSTRLSQPDRNVSPSGSPGGGRNELANFIALPVKFGNNALPIVSARVESGIVSEGDPWRQAEIIFAAARSAWRETNGNAAEIANQLYSAP